MLDIAVSNINELAQWAAIGWLAWFICRKPKITVDASEVVRSTVCVGTTASGEVVVVKPVHKTEWRRL